MKGALTTLTGVLLAGTALAGPSGGVVTHGGADIVGQGSDAVTINQNTNRVVIDWQNFDTQSHQSIQFNQLDSSSVALNRILSGSPTQFDGALNANGNVILMNTNGVVFGNSAQVDVNGLIATTVDVNTDSFMNDAQIRFDQSSNPNASVINHGTITAKEAGLVGFVAPHVENSGTINARLGKVQLESGDRFTFDLYGDGLIEIAASDSVNAQLVSNSGTINADGGIIQLQASAAKNVVDALVSNSGLLEARSVQEQNGVIILGGVKTNTEISGTLDTSGTGANQTGGRIEITGKTVNVKNATIDASGTNGGGDVRIGGGYKGGEEIHRAKTTTVNNATTISANATENGNGGTIVVWSDDMTDVSAKLSAKGGSQSGNGGLIETSSKGRATFGDTLDIDTSAQNGDTGLWYIDPTNFTIADSGGDITTATLAAQLNANHVTIETADAGSDAGDIFVQNALSWTSDRTLTLKAHRHIDISAPITNTNGGSLVLRADKLGSSTGTVTFSGTGSISMTGGGRTDVYYNPTAYTAPTNYSGNISGDYTTWMLVNDVNQLQAMNTNLSGSYALGRNIDASVTSTWNAGAGFVPIGNITNRFTGQFDGQNNIITGLIINRPTTNYNGLFGYADGAVIENTGLVDISINGKGFIGGLVGQSVGGSMISHNYVIGNVSGEDIIGGLVGRNSNGSTIINNYVIGNVSGSSSTVGGLVGYNVTNGIIISNYSMGSVSGDTQIGGLVGFNNVSTLTNSYSSASVTGNANTGGLLGRSVSSTVTNSYWDTETSGLATSAGGAGAVGLTSAQARQQASYVGWDFTNDWYMIEGETRPFGRWEYSTNITNAHQLQLMNMDRTAQYTLARDIDLAPALSSNSGMWTSAGFVPIGTNASRFTGQFDGQNHVINGLTINRPSSTYQGLFGIAQGAIIFNIGLTGTSIVANDRSGSLLGEARETTVYNSYAIGNTSGIQNIGLLVGINNQSSDISNSYAIGNVSGDDRIGGLAGQNFSQSIINNSYFSGIVTGNTRTGGLLGMNGADGSSVTNSYWDLETSGQATSAGGAGAVGLTTSQMRSISSFAGWDIGNTGGTGTIWRIYEGQAAPLLRHFMTPLTVTANNAPSKTYDGVAYSGGNGVTWSGFKPGEDVTYLDGALAYGGSAQGAVNVGTYTITPTGYYSGQLGYDIIAVSGSLTVTPRDITITADAASRTYGNTNPAFTYTVGGDGLVNGDTLSGALVSAATVTSNVGTYAITQGTLVGGNNYTITAYTGADLNVTQRSITITADAASRIYGNANPAFTYTVGGNGLVNGDTLSGALASAATVTSNVGDYAITQGTLTADSNYNITSYVGADLSITQRAITVAGRNQTRQVGLPNSPLSYVVGGQGLVNGDALTGGLTTLATQMSPMGSYAINQGTLAANANYAMTYVPGTIEVTMLDSLPPPIETGRKNGIEQPLQVKPPVVQKSSSVVTGSDTADGSIYSVDISQDNLSTDPSDPSANSEDVSLNVMSNVYKVFFTRELMQQLGYIVR